MLLHGAGAILLALLGTFGVWKASLAESGPSFLLYLLVTLVAIAIVPILIYRMYALQQARYILARDSICLHWGLRREDIPINMITWVGSTDQNRMALSKPFFRLPGAVLGVKTQPDGKPVEYLASRDTNLVMIVTSDRLFAISPLNVVEFLTTYRRLAEYGSLASIESTSIYPTFLLARSWADRPARILLFTSAGLALGLIVWVSLSIPTHPSTTLHLSTDGVAVEFVPGIRLLLLPVLNTFFFIADLLLGLFFYRRKDTQSLGYLMWASSALTSLLFSGAVYFILQAT
jgi:hypothetical protein